MEEIENDEANQQIKKCSSGSVINKEIKLKKIL